MADLVYHCIPPPTHAHSDAVTRALQRVCDEHGLSDVDFEQRQALTDLLRAFIQQLVPGGRVCVWSIVLRPFKYNVIRLSNSLV